MMRKINDEGIALIKQWEGLRLKAYQCSAGRWTIGYGHTATARPGMSISQIDADRLLLQDISTAEVEVSRAVDVTLTDNQFAALVSWTYNVGADAMRKSTLIRKLNAGDFGSVLSELTRWNKVNGKPNKGLTNRRAAEAGLWARGSFVASRDVEPSAPTEPSSAKEAGTLGGVAAAAAAAAPALTSLSGLHWAVGVALVAGLVGLAAIWLFKRRQT